MSKDKKKYEYDPEFETYWQGISALVACKLLDTTVQPQDFKIILYNAWLKGFNCGMDNAIKKLK